MSNSVESVDLYLEPADSQRLAGLCGPFNDNIQHIERRLGVEVIQNNNHFRIIGEPVALRATQEILKNLYVETAPVRGQQKAVDPNQVHLAIQESNALEQDEGPEDDPMTLIKTKRGLVKPRNKNQQGYVRAIVTNDINFGVGPAGTGKTYLAVAAAVDALERQEVRRILLTRPAVEAGEKLGFLPGDLAQKVDPYLRPLYDALFEMLGFEKVEKLLERNIIEIAPLAYMRGRTLNDAFIILDESQNTTPEQMKMFLTRIGFNSRAVITGDITQIDLPRGQKSGLRQAIEVLNEIEGISFTFFNAKDVVRHPVVQRVVVAYENFENANKAEDERKAEEYRKAAAEKRESQQLNQNNNQSKGE